MALYLVYRTDIVELEEYDSVLVRAKSVEEALDMVVYCHPDDDPGCHFNWHYPGFRNSNLDKIKVEEISTTGPAEVIISSYNG